MNVVVSAIVDPWVTTLSFVVALAMRIKGQNLQILCRNQAQLGDQELVATLCATRRLVLLESSLVFLLLFLENSIED